MHDGKAITKLQTVYSKSVPKIEKSNFVWIRIYKIEMDRSESVLIEENDKAINHR